MVRKRCEAGAGDCGRAAVAKRTGGGASRRDASCCCCRWELVQLRAIDFEKEFRVQSRSSTDAIEQM